VSPVRASAIAAAAAAILALPARIPAEEEPPAAARAPAAAQEPSPGIAPTPVPDATTIRIDIREFRIEGSRAMSSAEVERALSPFLGPRRPLSDVEAARAALEKAYRDAGFQTVTVATPRQTVRGGVITLQVTEAVVERLRVRGARWFLPSDIKRLAPSMAEGTVPNFEAMVRDIVALNQLPDRRVTPMPRAGATPGTVLVDLNVEDQFPLHGSLELNNRHGVDTRPLRLAGSLRYANLWQDGHTLGLAFQLAPQSNDSPRNQAILRDKDPDARVVTGTYLARFDDPQWLSLSLNGTYQDSTVHTAAATVKSSGHILGVHASFTLPGDEHAFHAVTAGVEYRRYGQDIGAGGDRIVLPITYWPLSVQYAISLSGERSQTQADAGLTTDLPVLSSRRSYFDDRRYGATPAFFYLRGDLTRSDDFSWCQLGEKLQWQAAWEPLLPTEQFALGGVDTVRGYPDAAVAGDYGAALSLELRTPSLAGWTGRRWVKDWRFLVFADGGWTQIHQALPEQRSTFRLASAGAGLRLRLTGFTGELDLGVPFVDEATSRRYHPRVHFRIASEF
jgi:hemolysin activation/secretion protein